ncbi:MAG: hypothetical protein VX112_03500 [Pseudomonadota bacterium]|nr:hypothetical protein [Pseudomonadota bacterium]
MYLRTHYAVGTVANIEYDDATGYLRRNCMFWSRLLPFFVIPAAAYATLSLELTEGTTAAIPIKIELDASLKASTLGAEAIAISEIIEADLAYTNKISIQNNVEGAEADFAILLRPSEKNAQSLCMQILDNYQQSQTVMHTKCLDLGVNNKRSVAHQFADTLHYEILGEDSIYLHKMAHVKEVLSQNSQQYSLRVADFDGGNAKTIAKSDEPIMSPSFSPDGSRIAYVSFENGRSSIFVQNIAKGTRFILADYPGINSAPAWSPSGKEIAVVLSISGVAKLYEMDLETKNLKKLTSGWYMDTEPVYTKDGENIVFTSNRGGSPQIYMMNRRTEVINQLTHEGVYNVSPSLAGKGGWLAFLTRLSSKLQVATLDLRTKELAWVGSGQYDDTPKISPRGDFIMYATTIGQQGVLEILSKNGKIRRRISEPGVNLKHPTWMPLKK